MSAEAQYAADYAVASSDQGVDAAWYLATYPDVALAGMDPVEHYLRHGWGEGRDPRPDFSTTAYAAGRPWLRGNPLLHHLGGSTTRSERAALLWHRGRGAYGRWRHVTRAGDWWTFKLIPVIVVFAATASATRRPLADFWASLGLLVAAIAFCAAYVGIINDITDRADDRAAGKQNAMDGRGRPQMALLAISPFVVGWIAMGTATGGWPVWVFYAGSWVAFSLYSFPPARLKSKGLAGVLADAAGAHLFPALTAAVLAVRVCGVPVSVEWIGGVAAWSIGLGVRGILWHELHDAEADRTAGVRTFVVRRSNRAAVRLGVVALGVEVCGLVVMAVWIGQPLLWVAAAAYAAFVVLRNRTLGMQVTVVEPKSGPYALLGMDFYLVLFPAALLIGSASKHGVDWAVVFAFLVFFGRPTLAFAVDLRGIVRSSKRAARARMAGRTTDKAIDRGTAFLRTCLHAGRYALDSVGADGQPNFAQDHGHVFVGAFLVEAMGDAVTELDRTIVLTRLLSEEQEGLWGYQSPGLLTSPETEGYLIDADDSAFVIRTLHLLGVNRRPDRLLQFFRPDVGLVVTWDIAPGARLTTEFSLANNVEAHPEVNANVLLALRGSTLENILDLDVLVREQLPDGSWTSFFYPSPLWATLLMLDLIAGSGAYAEARGRALDFVARSQNADGSWGSAADPYETALAVAALANSPAHRSATEDGVRFLLRSRRPDGSWSSTACIWQSYVVDGDLWQGYDSHRAFTTALCVIALRRARQARLIAG